MILWTLRWPDDVTMIAFKGLSQTAKGGASRLRLASFVLPDIGSEAIKSPVFLSDLLNDDMRVFWFFFENSDQRMSDVFDDFRFLLFGGTLGYLYVDVWQT